MGVCQEPDFVASEEVTLSYLMQINKDEFDVLGEDRWLEYIVEKFKSQEMLDVILAKYRDFFWRINRH